MKAALPVYRCAVAYVVLNSTRDSSIISLDSALLLLVVYNCPRESTFPIGRLRLSFSLARAFSRLLVLFPFRRANE